MSRILVTSVLSLLFSLCLASPESCMAQETPKPKEKQFMSEVSGEFDVKIIPADTGDPKMGMMMLDKKYHGELEATGTGRMLTGMTEVKNSAAYVAIERVEGKLKGASGSFLI